MQKELFRVKKNKVFTVNHDCKKNTLVFLHPSVANDYLVGICSGCKKQVVVKNVIQ